MPRYLLIVDYRPGAVPEPMDRWRPEERALEIAARVSAVPGPGGVPLRQPVVVRRAMSSTDFETLTA